MICVSSSNDSRTIYHQYEIDGLNCVGVGVDKALTVHVFNFGPRYVVLAWEGPDGLYEDLLTGHTFNSPEDYGEFLSVNTYGYRMWKLDGGQVGSCTIELQDLRTLAESESPVADGTGGRLAVFVYRDSDEQEIIPLDSPGVIFDADGEPGNKVSPPSKLFFQPDSVWEIYFLKWEDLKLLLANEPIPDIKPIGYWGPSKWESAVKHYLAVDGEMHPIYE